MQIQKMRIRISALALTAVLIAGLMPSIVTAAITPDTSWYTDDPLAEVYTLMDEADLKGFQAVMQVEKTEETIPAKPVFGKTSRRVRRAL